jgi:sulfite exporter TauE/SafE
VQGGLLASSLASQIEKDIAGQVPQKGKNSAAAPRPALAQPILLFLIAKLVVHTLLGFLLGALGSVFQLSSGVRAALQIGIGIFMLGNALRMFNVHPIFRYFAFEPPAFITRYIRRRSKNGATNLTPLYMGAMTLFIPCGVTQAMMALAIGTGSPVEGAAILFAFVLGSSPLFFTAAYLTARLGQRLQAGFTRFVAAVILILALVTIETGLNLAGSPISATNLIRSLSGGGEVASALPASDQLTINAQNNGYSPSVLNAPANTAVKLTLVTDRTQSCSRAFVIPSLNLEKILPVTGQVTVDIPPQAPGTVMPFSCSMGMYTGQIIFQ